MIFVCVKERATPCVECVNKNKYIVVDIEKIAEIAHSHIIPLVRISNLMQFIYLSVRKIFNFYA